ncbi:MAG: HEAT repeat domain-containing protein [Gemmatimonadaceae bacterium]
MRYERTAAIAATLIIVACVVPKSVDAQSIAQQVGRTQDGKVRFSFAAKPGVCGFNNSISRGGSSRFNWSSERSADVEYESECSGSPVRVVLQVRQGDVTKLRTYVGGRWRPDATATDLGTVPVKAATDYLLQLASGNGGSASHNAIMAATLADSVTVWPALARIARDESRPSATRKQALFWLAQEAGDHTAGGRSEKSDPQTEVKKQAVFALSQQKGGASVPTLIEVARRNRDPDVRRTALFWLGQTNDPRAVSFFEELLRR